MGIHSHLGTASFGTLGKVAEGKQSLKDITMELAAAWLCVMSGLWLVQVSYNTSPSLLRT